jgi:aryl-alcohol dehydrogenase-like predicted oxidoreductase
MPASTASNFEVGDPPVYDQEKLYDIVEVLITIAEGRGISAAQVALAWLIGRPGVTSVVIGARTDGCGLYLADRIENAAALDDVG